MLNDLEKLSRIVNKDDQLKKIIRTQVVKNIFYKNNHFPIFSFSIGTEDPQKPVLFLTGGIHGLERIGAQLAWSLLKTTIDRMIWDKALQHLLENIRLVIIPLLNPVGYTYFKRSNGNDVDLMRNSPVKAIEKTPFLLGGQRFSKKIPWFQGEENILEDENQTLVEVFESQVLQSHCVISLDFHSGFGMKDRLWFPYSYTQKPFENLAELNSLTHLFEQTHPYHIYQIEPQSDGYLLNGDMWDYLYLHYRKHNLHNNGVYLPLTLEMGSWTWVKKNPLQIFSRHGAFNPIKEHRIKRTYRRHHLLFDFFLKALYSNEVWSNLDKQFKQKHQQLGLERWY